jgi:hypothetical protein
MNYLNGKTCYLCGPIAAAADSGTTWRNEITPKLKSYGINVLDPCKKTTSGLSEIHDDKEKFKKLIMEENWEEHKKQFWPIARWDLRAVDKSDFLILNYDALQASVGTWHEVVMASHIQKKPVLLKYDRKQLDKFNFWVPILVKTQHLFSDWDKLFKELDKVNSGQFDTSYWTL